MELISVIVPVYNVEKYLNRCVQSIVDQTYTQLEIILVDDGSPDNCPAMCDVWAERDSRIKVIHQENAGGAAARNAALNVTKGDYIAFVDSDDYISPDMFSHLLSLLERGADIAECAHIDVTDDVASFVGLSEAVTQYTAEEAMELHIKDSLFRQLIWDKLYRKEVIGDIRFTEGKKIDDEFFTYQVLGNAKRLVRTEKIYYAYRQQEGSVMHSMSVDKRLQAVEAKVLRHQYIQKNFSRLTDLSLKDLWFTCMYQGQLSLREIDKKVSNATFEYLKQVLFEHPCKTNCYGLRERIWMVSARVSLIMTCRVRNLLKIGL